MKMLASINIKGISRTYIGLLHMGETKRRRKAPLRRRNRAREKSSLRRELNAN